MNHTGSVIGSLNGERYVSYGGVNYIIPTGGIPQYSNGELKGYLSPASLGTSNGGLAQYYNGKLTGYLIQRSLMKTMSSNTSSYSGNESTSMSMSGR